jgi:hypothetical protein
LGGVKKKVLKIQSRQQCEYQAFYSNCKKATIQ